MNIVCLSHLRWNFVFQRPQHLLRRAADTGTVLYVEEPIAVDESSHIEVTRDATGVLIAVPKIARDLSVAAHQATFQQLLTTAIWQHVGKHYVLWLYTPMALPYTHGLTPAAIVYDCMDELSAFAGAPRELSIIEDQLFRRADVVFTGGHSLFEHKRHRHDNIHPFPSSVDIEHFSQARAPLPEPPDQRAIRRPRLGFFGVLDERMDFELVHGVARCRPEWQLVLVGPTAKINPADLPEAANIHYLGPKTYNELPDYLSGWDVALLPFARNDATRFISPTKTPEYLAAGKPVVSTSIHDVVRPYGQQGLARIADTIPDFVAAVEQALVEDPVARCRAADAFLSHMSWDGTWTRMRNLVETAIADRGNVAAHAS